MPRDSCSRGGHSRGYSDKDDWRKNKLTGSDSSWWDISLFIFHSLLFKIIYKYQAILCIVAFSMAFLSHVTSLDALNVLWQYFINHCTPCGLITLSIKCCLFTATLYPQVMCLMISRACQRRTSPSKIKLNSSRTGNLNPILS